MDCKMAPGTFVSGILALIIVLVGVNSLTAADFCIGDKSADGTCKKKVLIERAQEAGDSADSSSDPKDGKTAKPDDSADSKKDVSKTEPRLPKDDKYSLFNHDQELYNNPYRFNAPETNAGINTATPYLPNAAGRSKWASLINSIDVPAGKDDDDDKKWRFEFQPYLWLTLRAKGNLRVDPPEGGTGEGVDVEIDLGPKELFSVDQIFSASGRFEAWRDRFGVIFDVFYLGVGVNTETTFLRRTVGVQVDADTITFDGAVSYRFGGRHPFRNNSNNTTSDEKKGWVEPYGGIRIRSIKLATRLSPGSTFDNTNGWVEPLVGVTAGIPISEKIVFDFRSDYSGFGIDSASDYTYNFLAGIDWRIFRRASLKVAYRRYGTKFQRVGRNGRPRVLDITTDGLWLGFAFRF